MSPTKASRDGDSNVMHRYKPSMKKIVEIASFTVLLGFSVIFGLLGKSVEMGLAIVAGALAVSLINIDKFRKIKGAGFEAELKEQVEAIIEKETEPYPSKTKDIVDEENALPDLSNVSDSIQKVINALQHPEYTWRYIGGIKQDTKLSEGEIKGRLKWLKENGLARQSVGKHGTIWTLTEEGRYLDVIRDFEEVNA